MHAKNSVVLMEYNTRIAFKKAGSGSFSIMFCDHLLSIKVVC